MVPSSDPSPFSLRIAFNTGLWRPQDIQFQEAMTHLHPEEQKRIKGFHFERDRKQALIGRLLILYACKKYFSFVSPQDQKPHTNPFSYRLGRTPQGRPIIVYSSNPNAHQISGSIVDPVTQLKDFDFNVSHHGSWVVCACEEGCVVGCDVTKFETNYDGSESVDSFFESFQQCFTTAEWRTIDLQTEDAPPFETRLDKDRLRLQNFHRHWGLKESYIKAVGIGLGFDLQSCQFLIPEPLGLPQPPLLTPQQFHSPQMLRHVAQLTYSHSPQVSPQFHPSEHQRRQPKEFPKIIGHTTQIEVRGEKQTSWRFEEILLDTEHYVAVGLGPISQSIPDLRKTFPSQIKKEKILNQKEQEVKEEHDMSNIRPFDASRANFQVLDWMTLRRGIV